jgi:PKD repeat protein
MIRFTVRVLFFWLAFAMKLYAQCNLNLPDTICPGQMVFLSTNLHDATFDACASTPGTVANIVSGINTNVYEYSVFKDKGKYYAFGQQFGSGYMHRFEFDNQFNFIASQLIAPVPAPSINLHIGSDMIKTEQGKYIALLPASDANKVLKFEFDSIDDNNPDVIDFPVPNFNGARGCKIIGNYLFVANVSAPIITRIEFDSAFQNIIKIDDITGPFALAWGIDIEFDCLSGNYFGFVANDGGFIIRLDFGNNLANPNPVTTVITSTYSETIGIDVEQIDNIWYLFTNNYGVLQRYLQFKLDSITAIPVLMIDTVHPSLNPFGVTTLTDSNVTRIFTSANFAHVIFQNQACITSPSWQNFSDSLSIAFNQNDTGLVSFDIKGFRDGVHQVYSDSVYVTVSAPVAGFKTNGTCLGQDVIFSDTSSICYGNIIAWSWSFGDATFSTVQNPVHAYSAAGTYQVALSVYAANADSATYTKTITVVPLPNANFTLSNDTACQYETVFFNDTSSSMNDSIVNWLWHFDTDSAITNNAQYAFQNSGNFSIQLIVQNSNGCVDTVTKPIYVLAGPSSKFEPFNTCIGSIVQFNNTTDTAGMLASYNWNFGDSNQSNHFSPMHQYAMADSTYLVTLTTQTSNGCISVFADSIAISFPAQISLSLSNDTVCKNESIVFINTSTYTGNSNAINVKWLFSDGSQFDNTDTVTHAFTQAGNQSVMLSITTATACDTFIVQQIHVLENPIATFITNNACFGDSIKLTSTATAPLGDAVVSYQWQLGNGLQQNGSFVTVSYDSVATYQIWHTVLTNNGCTDSSAGFVTVYPLPTANFSTPVIVCNDSLTQFVDFSFIPNTDTVAHWLWSFGNGSIDSLQNSTTVFNNSGFYQVQLSVLSNNGCVDDTIKSIHVKPTPKPAFVTTNNCLNDFTQFTFVNMAMQQGLINKWQWNFGEQGALSVLENPLHMYANHGTYIVTVTATDTNLCFASAQQPVVINNLPGAGFIVSEPCNESNTLFTDTTQNATPVSQLWLIQGQTFNGNSINYSFSNSGTYPISLTVSNDSGCINSIQKNILIADKPIASFTIQPQYALPLQTVNYTNTSVSASQYLWNFGNGITSTIENPTNVYADTGIYQNQLIAINNYGCSDTAWQSYNVLYPRIEVALTNVHFNFNKQKINVSGRLINLGNLPITSYQMKLSLDQLPEIVEMSNKIIPVGGQPILYDFNSSVALTDYFDPAYFCVEVSQPNNLTDDESNNKMCSAIDAKWQILGVLPQPVKQQAQLFLQAPINAKAKLIIYNIEGAIVMKQERVLKKGFNKLILDVNYLSNGIYLLQTVTDDVVLQHRIIKAN